MEFIGRMFTPSNSDGSGMVAPKTSAPVAAAIKKISSEPEKRAKTRTRYGGTSGRQNMLVKAEADVVKKTLLGG